MRCRAPLLISSSLSCGKCVCSSLMMRGSRQGLSAGKTFSWIALDLGLWQSCVSVPTLLVLCMMACVCVMTCLLVLASSMPCGECLNSVTLSLLLSPWTRADNAGRSIRVVLVVCLKR